MANEYLYGAFGHIGDDVAQNATQAGTVPVYVGIAPVNLVRGFATAGIINIPVKLSNINEAKRKGGYPDDWANCSLCEAIDAHFNNTIGNVGPIYMINVLDPAVHKKAQATTKELTFANKMATIVSDKIILDTFAIAEKVEGVDYRLSYDYGTKTLTIYDIGEAAMATISSSYSEVDLAISPRTPSSEASPATAWHPDWPPSSSYIRTSTQWPTLSQLRDGVRSLTFTMLGAASQKSTGTGTPSSWPTFL
jgi:hypothetical protein